jgi:hypothetical protein
VEWIGVGTLGDLSLTPRFFKGNIVTKYIKDQNYIYINPESKEQIQLMKAVRFMEINQLFLPGCSGGPIVSERNKVIGWVHGFNSWPIQTNNMVEYNATLSDDSTSQEVKIKTKSIIGASLSLGIEIKNVKEFLLDNKLII